MNITNATQKQTLLLYQAGQSTQEIFETLSEPETVPEGPTVRYSYDYVFFTK